MWYSRFDCGILLLESSNMAERIYFTMSEHTNHPLDLYSSLTTVYCSRMGHLKDCIPQTFSLDSMTVEGSLITRIIVSKNAKIISIS